MPFDACRFNLNVSVPYTGSTKECNCFIYCTEFPTQRPVTRSFDLFFDLRPNNRLSIQSWGLWFVTPSRPLWRHRYGVSSRWHLFVQMLNTDCVVTCIWFLHFFLPTEAEIRWPPFSGRHVHMHVLEWTCMNFDSNFTDVCSKVSN